MLQMLLLVGLQWQRKVACCSRHPTLLIGWSEYNGEVAEFANTGVSCYGNFQVDCSAAHSSGGKGMIYTLCFRRYYSLLADQHSLDDLECHTRELRPSVES